MEDEVQRRARQLVERRESEIQAQRALEQEVHLDLVGAIRAAESIQARVHEIFASESQHSVWIGPINKAEAADRGLDLEEAERAYAVCIYVAENGAYEEQDVAEFITRGSDDFCAVLSSSEPDEWESVGYTSVEEISRDVADVAMDRMAEAISSGGAIADPAKAQEQIRLAEAARDRSQRKRRLVEEFKDALGDFGFRLLYVILVVMFAITFMPTIRRFVDSLGWFD